MKYKRRKYGEDVVIYTSERGHYLTLEAKDFNNPWDTAGAIIHLLNSDTKHI